MFKPMKPALLFLFAAAMIVLWSPVWAQENLRRSPIVIAVEKASPAVVNISTTVKERVSGPEFPLAGNEFFRDFFPDLFAPREYTRTSLGSGVIIDGKNGYIVTNHHVVERAAEIKAITAAGEEILAGILGSDPRSDLAVLKAESKKRLPQIEMGNSSDLMIGETVIAIGNPFGLSHSVTTGVVSALERSVRSDEQIYRHFIQTDALINPGNSGGPLLNIKGELIGINTAIYQKAQGIGFAIPIDKAKRIVNELIRSGEVLFPWLGLEMQEMTDPLRAHFGLHEGTDGLLINRVVENGPSDRAGLRRGDILLSVEGEPLTSLSDYRAAISDFTPSDRFHVRFSRNGKVREAVVQGSTFPLESALKTFEGRLGIRVDALDAAAKRRYGLKAGVMIERVARNSEAERIGLQKGDLILKINQEIITDVEAFKKAVSRYHHLPSLTLVVQRGPYGYSLTLPF